ncbi:unnamed protein product [Arctogadus glacialis]
MCAKPWCHTHERLRTDCGTENGTMAAIQCTLRHHHNDYYSGASSHMYGSSTSNQRIESWWSIFRKGRSQFWMELFADLRDAGHFNGSQEHQRLLRYCFGEVIQRDLDECVRLWNSHRIRPSRTASCPGGLPNELYYLPHRFGSRDCGFKIEETELDAFPEAQLTRAPLGTFWKFIVHLRPPGGGAGLLEEEEEEQASWRRGRPPGGGGAGLLEEGQASWRRRSRPPGGGGAGFLEEEEQACWRRGRPPLGGLSLL